jgi:predicted hotdog family 3-hydroxylacyl-ACP dehydratase
MAFQYAVLRAVPRIDRGEFVNIGVILYCQQADFLRCAVTVDPVRLAALDPGVDLEAVRTAADAVAAGCAVEVGSNRRNDGLATRFGMLTAPRSTVVQPSPIHAGVTTDPERTLTELVAKLVEPHRR